MPNSTRGGNAQQYTRRECLDFSLIPNWVAPKDLENFILRLLQEIGINLDKSRIVACHKLVKTDRTIVKFLIWKDAENTYSNKKTLRDVDISCLLSDDDMQGRNGMTTGSRNDWREGGLSRKRKIFVSQNLWPYYRYLYGLVKEKKAEGLIFDFWVFNGTILMRELQDSPVINITHESDIWYFFGNFLDKSSLLWSFAVFCWRFVICNFFFINYYSPFFFPDHLGLFLLLRNNSSGNTKLSRVSLCFFLYIFRMSSPAVLARNRSFRIGSCITLSVALRKLR